MSDDRIRRVPAVSGETIDQFATALEQFASTLSDREYAILRAIVEEALPPLEKMRRRSPAGILTESERAIVDRLKAEGSKG